MSSEVLVALLALLGSAIGTIAGIFTNNKMVMYRIEQLEKTFKEEHIVSRVQSLESKDEAIELRLNTLEEESERIVGDIKQLKQRA